MMWYRVKKGFWYNPLIEKIEIERSTNNSVYIKGRRNAIISNYENYFPTFSQAHNYLIDSINRQIEADRERLLRSLDVQKEILNLKED